MNRATGLIAISIEFAFEFAKSNTQGIVLFMQADTWPGSATDGFGHSSRGSACKR